MFRFQVMELQSECPPTDYSNFTDPKSYFGQFEGQRECGITSKDLYIPPTLPSDGTPKHTLYCRNRATLLDAMSGGGRHGFEHPYFPAGCHYRWYSTPEICMILERFDAIVFIGDDNLKLIYAAFNMLLRQDIATGGLDLGDLIEDDHAVCRCDNQYVRPECSDHLLTDSRTMSGVKETVGHHSPYYCDRKSYPSAMPKTKIHQYRDASYVSAHHRLTSS